jgi:hypothetical protein
VGRLDVVHFRIPDQGPDQSVDESRVDVLDVGIDVDDNVTAEQIEGLPEVFAFARMAALFG